MAQPMVNRKRDRAVRERLKCSALCNAFSGGREALRSRLYLNWPATMRHVAADFTVLWI